MFDVELNQKKMFDLLPSAEIKTHVRACLTKQLYDAYSFGTNFSFFEATVEAETILAKQKLMRAWCESLTLMVDENMPEGEILLDALLYPNTPGEVRAQSEDFCTATVAMDSNDRVAIWTIFVYELKLILANIEDKQPGVGFLIDRDENREYHLRYLPEKDRYAFTWRANAKS